MITDADFLTLAFYSLVAGLIYLGWLGLLLIAKAVLGLIKVNS